MDNDPQETREWLDASRSVFAQAGEERAIWLLRSCAGTRSRWWYAPIVPTVNSSRGASDPGTAAVRLLGSGAIVPEVIGAQALLREAYTVLGTDGFGRSDARAALRSAIARYRLEPPDEAPWNR